MHLLPQLLGRLSPWQRDALHWAPFLLSGAHEEQSGAEQSVLLTLLDALQRCRPHVDLKAPLLR